MGYTTGDINRAAQTVADAAKAIMRAWIISQQGKNADALKELT